MKNIIRRLELVFLGILMVLSSFHNIAKAAEVTTDGVFRVGMEVNYAPFNWTQVDDKNGGYPISNSPGEYANGYDVAMAKKIADGLGLKLEILKIEWDGLIPALQSGKIDGIIAGMSPTEERKKEIDFSTNYYSSDLVIVVKKNSPFEKAKSISDFKKAKISAQLNTFHYEVIDQIEGVDKQDPLDSFSTLILNTKTGKIDGYVSERPGALSATTADKDLTFVEFEEGGKFNTSAEDTSIAVGLRKQTPLTDKVNKVLEGIGEDEREKIMEEKVLLQTESGDDAKTGFWTDVKDIWSEYKLLFLKGIGVTLALAIVATTIGFFIGLIVAVIRSLRVKKENKLSYILKKLVDFILAAYVEIFRGTPMMVQAILIFYGIPYLFDIETNAMVTAFVVVSINTGAYLSEVVRGGINSVDPGQMEGCKALGMTHGQAMRHVIIPQAVRNIIPSIGNELVVNLKDTAVLSVISVTELFFVSRSVSGTTNKYFQTYIIILVIYFIITFSMTRLIRFLEYRLFKVKNFKIESVTGGGN
ncbi:ABC transporter permease subunit [Lagierella sp.]|uniref:ABC transporter permease subunit n=1 Tax=Lagierella sp. TaxID=2849657 RepID=UPI00260793E8|nr:ABC transporter permease subunit [Lagierella sp.]